VISHALMAPSRIPGVRRSRQTVSPSIGRFTCATAFAPRAKSGWRLRASAWLLICDAGTFENPGGDALSADGVKINGNVLLHDRFHAKGGVRLTNPRIGGLVECIGGSLERPGDDAVLWTEGAEIRRGLRRR